MTKFNLNEKMTFIDKDYIHWKKEEDIKEFIKKTLDIVLDINKTDIRKAGEIKALAGDKLCSKQ